MFRKKVGPALTPQYLVVGLGNPGAEYARTRHNVGFDLVERIAEREKLKFGKTLDQALVAIGEIEGVPVALVKPVTFMNRSGQSVGPLARRWSIAPERILVVADDLDLPVGRLRLRSEGSSGGHNGHKSLIGAIGDSYPRVKIGVGRPDGETVEHVLERFKPDERVDIDRVLAEAEKAVRVWLASGIEIAMTQFNSFRVDG